MLSNIWKKLKKWYDDIPVYEKPKKDGLSDVSINNVVVSAQICTETYYSDYDRFFQKWDEFYNKDLGYEWFRICVERDKFPIYNEVRFRLLSIRKNWGYTQAEAAKRANISASTLSSYENGYTTPSNDNFESLAACYCIPLSFIKYGYVDDLVEHINLCTRYGEEEYMDSLYLSIKAASSLFPEMLTQEDKSICILINDVLDMKLDLFNLNSRFFSDHRQVTLGIQHSLILRLLSPA